MPKLPQKFFEPRKAKTPNGKCPYYIHGAPRGKRERFWYRTLKEAKQAAEDKNAELIAYGSQLQLADAQRLEASDCIKRLQPFGASLGDAVSFYLSHLHNQDTSITIGKLCDRVTVGFLRRREVGEISERHLTSMRETLKKLREQFGERLVKLFDGSEVKAWLATLPLAVKTRNRHFGYVKNIFGLAREWNLIDEDPFERTNNFKDPRKGQKVEILTPEEMEKFLSALDKDWLPFFAINAFTGLRREEISRLDWLEVKLDRLLIDLPMEKSKNGKRKLIEVPKNLLAILTPFAKSEGPVKPKKKLQWAMESAVEKAGIVWKQNCLRHSFCSYGVATHGLEWTADQADHSIAILRKDYREKVTKDDADKYWAVCPTVTV